MQSTNSHHALSVSNRKFYWNSIENFYEPITYDANPEIDFNAPSTGTKILRQPMPINMPDIITALEIKLRNININQFYRQNYETCPHFNRLRNLIISAEDEYKVILLIKHGLKESLLRQCNNEEPRLSRPADFRVRHRPLTRR